MSHLIFGPRQIFQHIAFLKCTTVFIRRTHSHQSFFHPINDVLVIFQVMTDHSEIITLIRPQTTTGIPIMQLSIRDRACTEVVDILNAQKRGYTSRVILRCGESCAIYFDFPLKICEGLVESIIKHNSLSDKTNLLESQHNTSLVLFHNVSLIQGKPINVRIFAFVPLVYVFWTHHLNLISPNLLEVINCFYLFTVSCPLGKI